MARRAERPAIISEEVDRFIERMLVGTAAILVFWLIVVNVWRIWR